MKHRHTTTTVLLVCMIGWLSPVAQALINPQFTPKDLVKQSLSIVSVDVKQGASQIQYVLTVREVLKGVAKDKTINLDLSKARNKQGADSLRKLAEAGQPALFFVGEAEDASAEYSGFLHISGQWASCVSVNGVWLYDAFDPSLLAVWNGGTDMLRRVIDYLLKDGDAEVPVSEGVTWSKDPLKAAVLDGVITTVRPVDLAGDGNLLLYVARDKGDRLLAVEPGTRKMTDVTAGRGLQSRSSAYAWGDFSGQGRLDLVSYDGKAVTLHAQQADGKFKSSPMDLGKALEGGCVSLAALDVGTKGRAGLLFNGPVLPVLIRLDAEGKASATALTAPGMDLAKSGKAGGCLVADFNGDGVPDILALREAGSILFRGESSGTFKPGVAAAPKGGNAGAGICTGDFDGDGCLDVLVFGGTARHVWLNDGKGAFTDRFEAVGEMMTHDQDSIGTDCATGDVNNDGRQDVLVAYGNTSPVTYFARGFLSFGHSHELDIKEKELLPDADNATGGQQSACLADVDGDGGQDLVLALRNGEIRVFFQENPDQEARMAVAALPVAGPYKGPVTVTGRIGNRCLGAWNVSPGVSQAWFGRRDAGPVTLQWRLPGGSQQQKEIVLEGGGITRVVIK